MKKKSHLFRNIIFFIISALFLLSFSYYIYTTYSNIEMSSEYDISKISTSNNSVSTTTNLDISNMLEDVSNCVVGISKIKSHSTSIFSTKTLSLKIDAPFISTFLSNASSFKSIDVNNAVFPPINVLLK